MRFKLLALMALMVASVSAYDRVAVHDPSVVWEPNSQTYYIFGSHRQAASTKDLINWAPFTAPWKTTNSNNATNAAAFTTSQTTKINIGGQEVTFDNFNAYAWSGAYAQNNSGETWNIDGNMWAPDVIYNPTMQKWCMYLSINGFYWNSTIILLTADQITGPYLYQGPVVCSGFTASGALNYKNTDLELVIGTQSSIPARYTGDNIWRRRWPHCIDPCVFYDEGGTLWMSYGSWSAGIWMLKLDQSTGLRDYNTQYDYTLGSDDENYVLSDPYFGKKIAGGFHVSGEASYIRHIGNYYYLFVTYGGLVANGGYQMRVFRSENPDGPYGDSYHTGAVAIYDAARVNYGANSRTTRGENIFGAYGEWGHQARGNNAERSQGHNSIINANDGRTYLVYHTRFQNRGEEHEVRVHQIFINKDGWPVAAPFEYTGEQVTTADIATTQQIATGEVAGGYKLLIHPFGLDNSNMELALPVEIRLNADGTVTGAQTGTWSMEAGTSYFNITLGSDTYSGVMIEQTLEPTSDRVPAFTVMNKKTGMTAWGYKFITDAPVDGDYTTGMMAYYDFNASPVTNQLDNSQTASMLRNGSATAPSLQTDGARDGQVMHTLFGAAGNESYVRFVNPLRNSTLSDGATVAFWVNVIDQNLWDALFSFYNTTNTARLYMTPNAYVGYNDMAGSWIDLNHPDGFTSGVIGFGVWEYVAMTISRTEGIKVYVNGIHYPFQKSSSASFDYNKIVDHLQSCQDFYFGFGSFWGSLNAKYDELAIYNRVLTADDIKALYATEVSGGSLPVTGIHELTARPASGNGALYDLQGRRVSTPQHKGIYIKDGKKHICK